MTGMAWRRGARGVVVGVLLAAGVAQAGNAGGVDMPDSLEVQGRTLALAHMELKRKLFFNVYVWSLYLEDRPTCTMQAVASDSLKRLHFRFLRNISREQLVDSFRDGLRRNPDLREGTLRQPMEALLGSLKDVRKGGDLVLTYVPGSGLHVTGDASGGLLISGKPFADALFAVWLDAHPIFPR